MRLPVSPHPAHPVLVVLGGVSVGLLSLGLSLQPVRAQAQRFLWSPGPSVGPATKVEPSNCVMAADGTITCDTKLVNPPGDTQAKPQVDYFRN